MLRLLAPRVITKRAARHRELGLDEAILDPAHAARTRNGIMSAVVVIEGRIAGVWSRAAKKGEVVVRIERARPRAAARASRHEESRWGRVAPGDCSPGAPTDPDVRSYRIRLLGPCVHVPRT